MRGLEGRENRRQLTIYVGIGLLKNMSPISQRVHCMGGGGVNAQTPPIGSPIGKANANWIECKE